MGGRPTRNITRWYARVLELAAAHGDIDQQQIAETIGVTKGTITGWKKGTPPKPESVIAAAGAYGVDVMELFAVAYLPEKKLRRAKPKRGPNGLL